MKDHARIFLFDVLSFTYLGEMLCMNGKMSSFVLSAEGEKRLGADVVTWQTQGIPSMKDMVSGTRRVLVEYAVQPRSSQFMSAFTDWALHEQLLPLHIPDHVVHWWEKIVTLPFTSRERLLFLRALCRAPVADAKAWDHVLDTALAASASS
jgi:hypothetical protein